MVLGDAARAQREHGERGVPDRRLTRLGPEAVAVLDHESLPAVDGAAQRVVGLRIVAERVERDDPPHPRRLDAAPRSVRLLARADPLLCAALCEAAKGIAADRRARAPGNRAEV